MWASRFDLIAIALMNMADWVKTLLEEQKAKAFDNFCNTIENLDQAWKDANLPISFEDDFLPAAADRTNFYPDTIKELYEAGKATSSSTRNMRITSHGIRPSQLY